VNPAEFRAFYEQSAPALRSYLRYSCRNASLADDLMQETYLRLLRVELPPLNEAARKSYLYKTARSVMLDHYRRTRREMQGPDDDWLDRIPAAEPADASGPAADIMPLLDKLKPRDRQLLWLAYVEGFSHREVAAVLGLNEKSVRVLLLRARERMMEILKGQGIGPGEAL
jgi:RNA polymerase sigma-70 factor (ECF subfamily)